MKVLLDKNKKFYKANLHTHSTYSDGKLTVEQVKEEYKKRGYSIVAITDHEHLIDNSRLDDEEFLTITSCEMAVKEIENVSTLKKFDMKVAHFNFYALDQHNTLTPCYNSVYDHYVNDKNKDLIHYDGEYERKYSVDEINRMIKIANDSGFIVSYNHPTWSLENATQYLNYDNLFAVEIYNHSCTVTGTPNDESVFEDMLRAGKKIYCTCCDDAHNYHDFSSPHNDSFGGWVCINAEKLEYSEIMNALKNGDFYASTGPEIFSLELDGDKVRIKTSPCSKICLLTDGRRKGAVLAENGKTVCEAEFTLNEQDKFFRLRIEDEKGKKAYTQAYYV